MQSKSLPQIVITDLVKLLAIDSEWSTPIKNGFEWWCHRSRQRVWFEEPFEVDSHTLWRMHCETDLWKGVALGSHLLDEVNKLNRHCALSCLIVDEKSRKIRFHSAVTINESNYRSIGHLMSVSMLMQIYQAFQYYLGADEHRVSNLDISDHPTSGCRNAPDEMLGAVPTYFICEDEPVGFREKNDEFLRAWSTEYSVIVLATGSPEVAVFEVPCYGFRNRLLGAQKVETALVRLTTTERHPIYGTGQLVLLLLPLEVTKAQGLQIASRLNQEELNGNVTFHSLGSWAFSEPNFMAYSYFLPTWLCPLIHYENLVSECGLRSMWAAAAVPRA